MATPNKKEILWLSTIAWAWALAYINYPQQLGDTIIAVKDSVLNIIQSTWTFVKDVSGAFWNNIPLLKDYIDIWLWLWSWAFLWYSLANAIEKDSKMLKLIWSLTWWFLWYWLSLTTPWTYIIWTATIWLWIKASKKVWDKFRKK